MGTGTTPLSSIRKPLQAVTRFLWSLKGSKQHIGIVSKEIDGDAPPKPLPTLATSHAEVHLTLATQGAATTTVSRRKQTSPPKGRHLYVAASKPIQKGETADLFATPSEQDAPASSKQTLKPLRIVHSRGGKDGGRLVISGRMADVCAELDRMAAREAALAYG
ncbi:hypothetical protein [Acidovorax temperans]|uniref:hypothetical protein n=1 Tax=Acidovorax temperans TaxID=80878 RepID=UPI0035AFA130